jgi:hypothetical protein
MTIHFPGKKHTPQLKMNRIGGVMVSVLARVV